MEKLSTFFRHWSRPQIYVLAVSGAVVVLTIATFAVVKFSARGEGSLAASTASASPRHSPTQSSTPTPSGTPGEQSGVEGEIYLAEDPSYCDFSYEEIAQFAAEREKAQASVDFVQSELDAEKANLEAVQAKISELEKGPWFHTYVDSKTQQLIYGTIEQHQEAVQVDLPHFTELVTSLESQVAQAQASVPPIPCSG